MVVIATDAGPYPVRTPESESLHNKLNLMGIANSETTSIEKLELDPLSACSSLLSNSL
jgi:hypothetical protein